MTGASSDRDGLKGLLAAQDAGDLVDQALGAFPSALAVEGREELKAVSQGAAQLEVIGADVAAIEDGGPAFIVKDNVFESAFDKSIIINLDAGVPERFSYIIHGNKFLRGCCGDITMDGAGAADKGGARADGAA